MENKNYYWIILVLLVLVVGGFWYYQTYQVNPKSEDESSEVKIIDSSDTISNNVSTSTVQIYGEEYEKFLIGTWQNSANILDMTVIKQDGTIENIYDGDLVSSGTWKTEGYHLKITTNGQDKTYTVLFAGNERLQLAPSPAGTGNNLNFTRVIK
ncbi:TPA: hypothetical protein DCZ46_01695 [Candidatus Campbellbacteria bacterium]|nr:MAG: seg [Candidatus Campbellbacteria bacterium GW2011_OD1_34_28]KKP75207.1 MAG: hypothetical protein UR74_C0001G0063 [Candidatus Campbellbacteria bacterium GW2011_GWD2_35_24]KKP76232.1 MAG: hypothetical protein UR75_C0001G0266 [Candidatus Campbellbacteria bacterium GW2011_GWC2_35_28]KKP77421.1 MAG: hypothetical protein UR76_C0001G0266 [Candidatus Campbellbacteria bacterium GW2011_GWC1_35_31]KKP79350.1 MAG: hypothetical protein UR79_C0001G0266 [Candidatus Campbellbacteria bacterium GW2011_GW